MKETTTRPRVPAVAKSGPASGTQAGVSALSTTHPFFGLQQTVGNQAVQRLIQAKLLITPPGDSCEQEADEMADRVIRMLDSRGSRGPNHSVAKPDDKNDSAICGRQLLQFKAINGVSIASIEAFRGLAKVVPCCFPTG